MGAFTSTKSSGSEEGFDDKNAHKLQYGASIDQERQNSSAAMAKDETLAVLDIPQEEDPHHPRHWPTWKRWGLTVIYCSLQSFVTITSTSYISAEYDIGLKFPASTQVITLGQSMFILGTAIGPIFLGPLADVGRNHGVLKRGEW